MGTREALLAAAKKCLAERGYAKTTVRDIVAMSETNLAAINYHFRTREALLHEAMIDSMREAVETIVDGLPADGDMADRLRTFWTKLTEAFTADRDLWAANVEALAVALHSPELRARLAGDQQIARDGLSHSLSSDGPEAGGGSDAAVGAVVMTLMAGLLVQWMVDPERAPTPDQVNAGLTALTRNWS
ncbi:TetR/AcrR family transcriptional regulator [Phytomonospora sp. NPDC050363]|uniref:TetR/AcrR family transcriptional regulator n=1 Tax=Phytomonospora sp. NPDC050363 TaxID=3155642 RepID=UPI0033DD04CA